MYGAELHPSGRHASETWVGFVIRVAVTAVFHNKACLAEYASTKNLLRNYTDMGAQNLV